ncbi:MAG: TIM barrel protein, partial [Bacteroidetes bacterium]|nr:TIM barrel protein [Bacteroidota bacterium]
METPDLFFNISLAQWSLHKSIFGETLYALDGKKRVELLRQDSEAALGGSIKPLDFAKVAREFGIDAIEYVSGFYLDKAENQNYLNELKSRADGEGVKSLLIMVDDEGHIGDTDEDRRNQAVENHYKWVDAAKFLGCHSIRVNAAGEDTADEVKQAAIDGLGKLTEYGAQNEINIIVENHG